MAERDKIRLTYFRNDMHKGVTIGGGERRTTLPAIIAYINSWNGPVKDARVALQDPTIGMFVFKGEIFWAEPL